MSNKERYKEYVDILSPILKEIKAEFFEIFNEQGDLSKLPELVNKIDNARKLINSMDNTGLLLAISGFIIFPYPLTGDPSIDLGQNPTPIKLDENE